MKGKRKRGSEEERFELEVKLNGFGTGGERIG